MKLNALFSCINNNKPDPSPMQNQQHAATASVRPLDEPPLIHRQGSSSSFFFKSKSSLTRTWSSFTSSIRDTPSISRKTTSTTLSKDEWNAVQNQQIGAQAIQDLVVSGAHLAEVWNPSRIEHVLGLATPVIGAGLSELKEIRINLLKDLIEQGAAGSIEGKSPLRTTTTHLMSLQLLEQFTTDPDLLDLAKSAREILEMPISEADGKGKERVTFRAFGDPRVFESPTKLGNGFDFKAYENMEHALNEISKLGERSATLLKQKFTEYASPSVAPPRKETPYSQKGGRSAKQEKGFSMFARHLRGFRHGS